MNLILFIVALVVRPRSLIRCCGNGGLALETPEHATRRLPDMGIIVMLHRFHEGQQDSRIAYLEPVPQGIDGSRTDLGFWRPRLVH